MEKVTGISKDDLHVFEVACQPVAADSSLPGSKMKLPFALLSTHVQHILHRDPEYFKVRILDRAPDIAAADFLKSREYVNHAFVQDCWLRGETVIPVGLYSDGVSVCADPHADSLYVIYLHFLHLPLHQGGRPESKFVFTVYRKSEATAETLQDIWRVLLWDLQALSAGRKPVRGQERLPLEEQDAGDHIGGNWGRWNRILLMQVKGDWAWYAEALGVWQWNAKGHMCPFCGAHGSGVLSWKDFSFDAPWRSTCRTHGCFLEALEQSKRNNFSNSSECAFKYEPLLCSAPGFRWTMVKLDWMHAADLGVLVHVIGEVWWSLLVHLAGGGARSQAVLRERGLVQLRIRLRQFYVLRKISNRLPLKRLTLRKIKVKGTAKLKAKAAQAKELLPFTITLANEFRDRDGAVGERRCHMLLELEAMYNLASQHQVTHQDLMDWRANAAMFMYHYVSCGYKVYPKFHYLLHIPEQVEQSGALRSFWVYAEESKNSQLKQLFSICSKGHGLHQQMLLRMLWWHALLNHVPLP